MRAHTITTMSRRRRSARRRRALALGLGVCALAIPASAIAQPNDSDYSSVNAIAGGSGESSQPGGGSDHSSVNSIVGGSSGSGAVPDDTIVPSANDTGYSSPNALLAPSSGEPTFVSDSPAGTGGGFDWASAAVGAGAALAFAALGGAVLLTVRRRTPVSPTASTS